MFKNLNIPGIVSRAMMILALILFSTDIMMSAYRGFARFVGDLL